MKPLRRYWILLMALALILVACGGDDDSKGGNPVAVNLTQSLTGEQEAMGSITLHYQDGWVGDVQDSGTVVAATSQSVLERLGGLDPAAPTSGEGYVSAFVVGEQFYGMLGSDALASPVDAVTSFVSVVAATDGVEADFSETEAFDAGGRAAAIAGGVVTEAGKDAYGVIYTMVAVEGGMGLITIATHRNEVNNYLDLARAMAGQLEFTPEGSF